MSLDIENVSKRYKGADSKKFNALDHITISMEQGSIMALIGQNGAGKTTLMKCMLGFVRPESGNIKVDGLTVGELNRKNDIGFMPENVSNIENITGREYITGLMMLRGVGWESVAERFEHLVKELFLEKYMDIPMGNCSKGNFKKIIFLQSLLHAPKMLILDEPTDGLDPVSRRHMLQEIRNFKNEGGYTIISTHLLSDIEVVADEVVILQKGCVLSKSKVSQLDGTIDEWYIQKIEESGRIDEL